MTRLTSWLILGTVSLPCLWAQENPPVKTMTGNPEGGFPYKLHVAESATPEHPHHLILWLHPSGGSGNDLAEALVPVLARNGFALLVVTDKQWNSWNMEEAGRLLNKTLPDVKKSAAVDVEKPVLMGFSAGGQVALMIYWENSAKLGGMILDAAYPLDMDAYAQGKVAAHTPPRDSGAKTVPILVLVGDQDGGSQLWKSVEASWLQAGLPLTVRYVAGRKHEWLFGKPEIDALDAWLKQTTKRMAAAKVPPGKPCANKTLEKGFWCPKCADWVEKSNVLGGKCKKDGEKLQTVEVCVRKFYRVDTEPDKVSDKPITVDGKTYDKAIEDRARVLYRCDGCSESAFVEKELKHKPECKTKKTRKSCEKSGTFPHIG